MTQAQTAASQGYVLGATEGEHLVHWRDAGNIFIKVGPATGSDDLALGTQQVPVGAGIPIHRHFRMDEAFYVLEGSGIFTLNDAQHRFEKGGTIFIPKNAWHGFANPDHELLLLWIMAPPGLEGFFRDTCSPPGVPPKQLTLGAGQRDRPQICDGIQIIGTRNIPRQVNGCAHSDDCVRSVVL